jgi:hypothetical protein
LPAAASSTTPAAGFARCDLLCPAPVTMDAAREEFASGGLRGASLWPRLARRAASPTSPIPPTSSSTVVRPLPTRYAAADPTRARLGTWQRGGCSGRSCESRWNRSGERVFKEGADCFQGEAVFLPYLARLCLELLTKRCQMHPQGLNHASIHRSEVRTR